MAQFIPANEPIPVILARNSAAAAGAPVGRPAVALIPSYSSTWNDFGRYLHANLWVFSASGTATELGFRLMFEGASRTDTHLSQVLGTRDWVDIAEANTLFCSVLDNVESCDTIVRHWDLRVPLLLCVCSATQWFCDSKGLIPRDWRSWIPRTFISGP